MAKQMSFRLNDVTVQLIDKMVEALLLEGMKTNKTDIVQKAVYFYAKESVLPPEKVREIIEKHYSSFEQF